jgi:hypothetical protein
MVCAVACLITNQGMGSVIPVPFSKYLVNQSFFTEALYVHVAYSVETSSLLY